MNDILALFVNFQFLLLCLGIAAITFIFRAIIEYAVLNNPKLPGNSASKFWRDVVLVIFPVILGFLFPFVAKTFTYPTVVHDSITKFLFSATAGLLSPVLYRVIKALLWKTVGSNDQQNFMPSPTTVIVTGQQGEGVGAESTEPADDTK